MRSFSPSLRTFLNSVRSLRPCRGSQWGACKEAGGGTHLNVEAVQRRDGERCVCWEPKIGKGQTTELSVVKVVVERERRGESKVLLLVQAASASPFPPARSKRTITPSRVSLGIWNGMFLITIAVGILYSSISSVLRINTASTTHTSSSGGGRPTNAA